MRKLILSLCIIIAWLNIVPPLHAQYSDSVRTATTKKGDFSAYKPSQDMTYMGLPLIAMGFFVKSQKKDFREIRNNFEPTFHHEFDNYTQYLPLALTYGLKIAGVEGRSDWKRFLVSNVFSYATMAAFINGIKYTTKEMRPDGTSANSFPSGHTATVFMCATILHKEYGLTRSPWYSIAGYTVAAGTGVMRMLNNRHWISDVLVGAGIGVMSVDLGYLFGDLLFKDKGLVRGERDNLKINIRKNPSFIGLSVGAGLMRNSIDIPDEEVSNVGFKSIKLGSATSAAVEGAYFFNPYFGVGGRVKAITVPAKISKTEDLEDTPELNIISNNMGVFNLDAGAYLALPIGDRFNIGTKFFVGRRFMSDLSVKFRVDLDKETDDYIEYDYMKLKSKATAKFGTGLYFTYAYKQNMTFKVFADYDFDKPTYDIYTPDTSSGSPDYDNFKLSYSTQKHFGIITLGTSLNISF